MKKKLLTVLLAVVMVFGVFGLTACGGSNADADYNYYGVKYELEDEVKIEAVTYQAVYRMFTTAGNFLMYVDTETGANTKANFQAINKLANDWNVTIYHFNPDLSGGYAKDLSNAVTANLFDLAANTGKNVDKALASDVGKILKNLNAISVNKWSSVKDANLVAIGGVAPTWKAEFNDETGKYEAVAYYGSYSSYTGTWSSPIKSVQSVADGAKAIASIATKVPSYGVNAEGDNVPYVPAAYNTTGINTMNLFADARLHMYDDAGVLTAEKEDVYVTVANYAMFAHLLANNEGYFPVFFGGTWCPNTQAIVKATDKLAKDYGIEKIYFFDPRLDDGTVGDSASVVSTVDTEKAYNDMLAAADLKLQIPVKEAAIEEAQAALDANEDATKVESLTAAVEKAKKALEDLYTKINDTKANAGIVREVSVSVNGAGRLFGNLNTRDADKSGEKYNYNFLYGKFLDEYLPTYISEWNVNTYFEITVGDAKLKKTKMCVPNIMMFNGEEEGKAELVALAEAEYTYANVEEEGNPQQVEWDKAVKAVFDANPYAEYLPIVAAPEAAAPEASAPAASAPAADAGGC